MTARYAATVGSLGWLVDSVERRLEDLPDGSSIDVEGIRGSCPGRRATVDEATAVLEAMAELGVLTPGHDRRVLKRGTLLSSASYRAGVRAGLAVPRARAPSVRLCAALPSRIDAEVEDLLRQSTEDLRGSLVDLVAEAREDLVLASPFWDASTLADIAPILSLRLEAGVRVRLLGRFGRDLEAAAVALLAELAQHPRCRLLRWYEPSEDDPLGTHSFHFKAAVADHGARAYLGTANFTMSGLRSRLEFGVLLLDESASRMATVVEAVLRLARPIAFARPDQVAHGTRRERE